MASTYLTRTVPSDGNRKTWTWSAWVKGQPTTPTNSMSGQTLFSVGTSVQNRTHWFISDGYFTFRNEISDTQLRLITNRTFTDPNGWYHLVLAVDTTQSTASNRVKLYVNGEQVTSFSTEEYPNQNDDTFVNNNQEHRIGSASWSSSSYWNGLMSHINFCDGTQLAPTVFGSTDATTGEWKINTSPSFTLGTNGFTILKDGNTITDQSTNSNDWSLGGGTLTKTEDNPSNVFATGNSLIGVHSNGNTLVPTFSNGNNTATATGSAWRIFKSTLGASSGKYYAEFKWISDSNTRYAYVGIYDEDNYANKVTGYPYMSDIANSVGYYGTGVYYTGGSSTSFGNSYSTNNIIGCAVDLDNNKLYFSKDGAWQGGGNPTNGTGGISITANRTYTFGLQLYSAGSIVFSANFGNGYFGTTAVATNSGNGYAGAEGKSIFNYQPPTGYSALSTRGLNE